MSKIVFPGRGFGAAPREGGLDAAVKPASKAAVQRDEDVSLRLHCTAVGRPKKLHHRGRRVLGGMEPQFQLQA